VKQGVFITIIFILIINPVFSETTEELNNEELDLKETIPSKKPYVSFNYGPTATWLTRIIKQENRSNFVLRDFLPGMYFTTELHNILYNSKYHHFNPAVRLAVYYPLVSSFNYMPQKLKNPLNLGLDLFAGARYVYEWKFLSFSAGLGLHMFFMTSDRWYYVNLGAAVVAGVELAFSPGWSLLIDGFFSYDNANLGTNRLMEPFNNAYQYQTAIGVRYSKKKRNTSALFMPKKNDDEDNSLIFYNR